MGRKADDTQDAEHPGQPPARPVEHDLELALRRWALSKLRGVAVFAGGSVAGAGGVTVAQHQQPPAAVAPTSAPTPAAPALESIDAELACAQARRDARLAIDYFAELADACELPRHARPKIPRDTPP